VLLLDSLSCILLVSKATSLVFKRTKFVRRCFLASTVSIAPSCVKDMKDSSFFKNALPSSNAGGTILFVRLRNLSLPNRCFILGKPLVSTIEFPMDALCSIDATPRKTCAFFFNGSLSSIPHHPVNSFLSLSSCLFCFDIHVITNKNQCKCHKKRCFWQAIILSKIITAWRGQCSVCCDESKGRGGTNGGVIEQKCNSKGKAFRGLNLSGHRGRTYLNLPACVFFVKVGN
jgi:hypothetical protein